MTNTTIAGKGQGRHDDVTSIRMTGKMGTGQISVRCSNKIQRQQELQKYR